jgi:hypothetical protein
MAGKQQNVNVKRLAGKIESAMGLTGRIDGNTMF